MNRLSKAAIVVLNTSTLANNSINALKPKALVDAGGQMVWTHAGILPLEALGVVPDEYRKPGNILVSSIGTSLSMPVAHEVRLFVRRLQSDFVWDEQTRELISLP